MDNSAPCIIYTGGTLGCVGSPLSPAPLEILAPHIQQLTDIPLSMIALPELRDSSALTPNDWLQLCQLIHTHYARVQRFIIIHGTDTLAYTAAFLAEVYAYCDIQIIMVGSQAPLLHGTKTKLNVDTTSDAYDNLIFALNTKQHFRGIAIACQQRLLAPMHAQKISTSDHHIFSGIPIESYVTSTTVTQSPPKLPIQLTPQIIPIYLLPNQSTVFQQQLSHAIDARADAIVLLAFGSGNMPLTQTLGALLSRARMEHIIVVRSSQVAFAMIDNRYSSGHSLAGLCETGYDWPVSTIYAKLLWMCSRYSHFEERLAQWRSYSVISD